MFVAKIKQKIQEGIANLPTSLALARIKIRNSKDQKGKARDQDQQILENIFKVDIVFNKCLCLIKAD